MGTHDQLFLDLAAAEVQRDMAREQCQRWIKAHRELEQEWVVLRAKLDKARAALKAIDDEGCDGDCYYVPDPCSHKRAHKTLEEIA